MYTQGAPPAAVGGVLFSGLVGVLLGEGCSWTMFLKKGRPFNGRGRRPMGVPEAGTGGVMRYEESAVSELEVKIYYEDTDCGGVVYHANYLRYFERARTEYFGERGISIRECMRAGTLFVVVRADLHYESPAVYGDVLVVSTTLERIRRVSLDFNQVIRRKHENGVLVKGKIRLACVDGERRLTELPKEIMEVFGPREDSM
jgi:acyl-CoA thioester hydrolase